MSQNQYTDGGPDDAPQRKSLRRRTTLAKEDSFNDDAPDSPVEDEEDSAEEGGKKKERKGRRKISISFIEDKSRRHITFSKRKAGIMKKAYELATLTGTQVLLLVASETGHVYTFATPKLQPLITKAEGKNLIQSCLNAPDVAGAQAAPPTPTAPTRLGTSRGEAAAAAAPAANTNGNYDGVYDSGANQHYHEEEEKKSRPPSRVKSEPKQLPAPAAPTQNQQVQQSMPSVPSLPAGVPQHMSQQSQGHAMDLSAMTHPGMQVPGYPMMPGYPMGLQMPPVRGYSPYPGAPPQFPQFPGGHPGAMPPQYMFPPTKGQSFPPGMHPSMMGQQLPGMPGDQDSHQEDPQHHQMGHMVHGMPHHADHEAHHEN